MNPSPSRGALGFWAELPRDGRWLLSTVVVNTFGRGLTLPFTIIYLHEVRGFSLDLAGALMGLIAVAGLLVTVPAGVLIDRFGARGTLLAGIACAIAGQTILAFATVPWVAAVGLALFGAQFGVAWPANNALISTVVGGDLRQRYFGVNFALVNLGIGAGGVVGGMLVDVERPVTFVVAFLVNAATFAAPVVVLLGPLRHLRPAATAPAPAPSAPSDADGTTPPAAPVPSAGSTAPAAPHPAGYLAILRRPEVAWLTALAMLAAFAGYGQMESGFPAYARQVAEVSTRTVGLAFVVNTAVIVLSQFWVMERARGHRRTRVLALFGLIWSGAWLVLGLSGLVPGTAGSVALVLGFMGVFALGEALLQSALPALTNDLAPDHLRGRYNALSSAAFQVGTIAGPVAAGLLLDRGHPGAFVGMVAVICAAITATAFVLGRRVAPDVDRPGSAGPADGDGRVHGDGEAVDDERADDERADDERADDERADDERADDERADDERADSERADSERADSERADDERADSERADSERADSQRADGDGRADLVTAARRPGPTRPGSRARTAPSATPHTGAPGSAGAAAAPEAPRP